MDVQYSSECRWQCACHPRWLGIAPDRACRLMSRLGGGGRAGLGSPPRGRIGPKARQRLEACSIPLPPLEPGQNIPAPKGSGQNATPHCYYRIPWQCWAGEKRIGTHAHSRVRQPGGPSPQTCATRVAWVSPMPICATPVLSVPHQCLWFLWWSWLKVPLLFSVLGPWGAWIAWGAVTPECAHRCP